MQWITIATPNFGLEQFDKVRAQVSEEPDGLEARYVGTTDGSLRVITVWETKEHADRFFAETLGPVLAKALGPEPVGMPETVGIQVTAELRTPTDRVTDSVIAANRRTTSGISDTVGR